MMQPGPIAVRRRTRVLRGGPRLKAVRSILGAETRTDGGREAASAITSYWGVAVSRGPTRTLRSAEEP
jgi:hypothetical protein